MPSRLASHTGFISEFIKSCHALGMTLLEAFALDMGVSYSPSGVSESIGSSALVCLPASEGLFYVSPFLGREGQLDPPSSLLSTDRYAE